MIKKQKHQKWEANGAAVKPYIQIKKTRDKLKAHVEYKRKYIILI